MIVNTEVLESFIDRWFPMRTIRIEADPELLRLGHRVMDYLEGNDQKKIDAVTATLDQVTGTLRTSTEDLKTVLPKETQ